MDATDCQPDFCLDLYEPSGHGRRRRSINANTTEYTKFKENIEYTVTVPGEYDEIRYTESDQCRHFVIISILLSALLALSTILVRYFIEIFDIFSFTFIIRYQTCALVFKIQSGGTKTIDHLGGSPKGYAGRAIVQ